MSGSTNWAATAHLPYLHSSRKYEIVTLCNSSIERAHASIEKYGLEGVKVYGSPQELAKDPNVDLAVCVVGVERHYEILKPLVEAGKNVFTELPLAASIDQMREPVTLAAKQKIRTMIGMQGQVNPVANLIKSLISKGKLGKVHKPAPESLKIALRLLKLRSAECVMVAAHANDVRGAKAAGMKQST